jgi:hypothetical protein
VDWKTRHQGLSPEEAKAQLLAISQECRSLSFVGRNPLTAVVLALLAGIAVTRAAPLLGWAGRAGWSIASQFLLPQAPPAPSALERIRERTYRRGMR